MANRMRGAALLEAIAALALLGTGGSAVVGVLAAGLLEESRAAVLEGAMEDADRLLVGLTLLDRGDLDRRLGARVEGAMLVVVTRPEPTLYRIAIASTDVPDTDLLTTVVYRERVE